MAKNLAMLRVEENGTRHGSELTMLGRYRAKVFTDVKYDIVFGDESLAEIIFVKEIERNKLNHEKRTLCIPSSHGLVNEMVTQFIRNHPSGRMKTGMVNWGTPEEKYLTDMEWFISNLPKLLVKYPNKWVAIVNNQVVVFSDTPQELREQILEQQLKKPFITRVSPESWGNPDELSI